MTNTTLVLKAKRSTITAQKKQDMGRWLRILMEKDLILDFVNFLFREMSIRSLESEGEEEMNYLKFEINDITESVGVEGGGLSKIRKVVAYK